MNKLKKIYLPLLILFLMYLISFQVFLPERIRQNLRRVLGYINLIFFPILILLQVIYFAKITKYKEGLKKIKYIYVIFSLLIYAFIGYLIFN